RFGGVPKMVLSGITAGFLLYVLSKVTEDLSKAELMHPAAAAWLPVLAGGLTGFVALLYQEGGQWPERIARGQGDCMSAGGGWGLRAPSPRSYAFARASGRPARNSSRTAPP